MEEEIFEEVVEEKPKLYRVQESEEGEYIKDDKRYELQSCNEFLPAKNKTIDDYGWKEFETEEQAIQHFGLTKVENNIQNEVEE